MKKIILFVLLIILCGCTDYKELSDMSIISIIGIDKKEKYEISLLVLDYKGIKNSKEQNNTVYKSEGNTINEAFKNVMLTSTKTLYLGHTEVILVSKNLAENDISEIFDYFLRDAKTEKNCNLVIADTEIDELLNIAKDENNNSFNIADKIDITSIIVGNTSSVSFDTFVSKSMLKNTDPVLPIIYKKENKVSLYPFIAIFSNNKLETYLSTNSTIGYNIINNNKIDSVITFDCNDKISSIEIDSNKTTLKYNEIDNTITINTKIKGSLKELSCKLDLNNEDNVNYISNQIKNKLKDILNETINDHIKYNSKYLGIDNYIYKNNYKSYNDSIFNDMKYIINIDFSLISKGSIKGDDKY